jgi:hypothetical protein
MDAVNVHFLVSNEVILIPMTILTRMAHGIILFGIMIGYNVCVIN